MKRWREWTKRTPKSLIVEGLNNKGGAKDLKHILLKLMLELSFLGHSCFCEPLIIKTRL